MAEKLVMSSRTATHTIYEGAGYEAHSVRGGCAARSRADRGGRWQAAMDGYQATQAIRTLDHSDTKTVPIIAMTASAYHEDVERAQQMGMNGHLAKPVDISAVRLLL